MKKDGLFGWTPKPWNEMITLSCKLANKRMMDKHKKEIANGK